MRYTPFIESSNAHIRGLLVWLPQFRGLRRFQQDHRFFVSAAGASLFAGVVVFSGMSPTFLNSEISARAPTIPSTLGVVRQDIPTQGLNIANSGLTYLQGARVASVSGSRIEVVSEWNTDAFHWTIQLHSGTRYVLPSGEVGALSDINNGDFVAITGNLSGQSSGILIEADIIRLTASKVSDAPVVYLQEISD